MTPERLAQAIAEIDQLDSRPASSWEEIVSKDMMLRMTGIAIELDSQLTEEERNTARNHYFTLSPSGLDCLHD